MSWQIALDPIVMTLLGSVRLVFLLTAGPAFSHSAFPARLRLSFALVIAWALAPSSPVELDWRSWTAFEFAGAVAVEALIGITLGFASRLIFTGFLMLGEFISIQGGLGAARNLDPDSGASSVVMGAAFNVFALLVFFSIDGHHALLRALASSYGHLPLAGAAPEVGVYAAVASMAAAIYEVAVRLAAPVTVSMFVQNVGMGVLGRAMPQLNLMMVQLPLHILMVLAILGWGAFYFIDAVAGVLGPWSERVSSTVLGGV